MDWTNFESLNSKVGSPLVPFLKCDRKIPVEEQHFQKLNELHFIVNLYKFPLPPEPAPGNLSFPFSSRRNNFSKQIDMKIEQKNKKLFFFITKINNKKNLNTSAQRCLSPLFQRTLFLLPPLFQRYLKSQVIRTNKMVNSVNTTLSFLD